MFPNEQIKFLVSNSNFLSYYRLSFSYIWAISAKSVLCQILQTWLNPYYNIFKFEKNLTEALWLISCSIDKDLCWNDGPKWCKNVREISVSKLLRQVVDEKIAPVRTWIIYSKSIFFLCQKTFSFRNTLIFIPSFWGAQGLELRAGWDWGPPEIWTWVKPPLGLGTQTTWYWPPGTAPYAACTAASCSLVGGVGAEKIKMKTLLWYD